MNPRKSGDYRKAGTRFAACDQPLLAIYRSDANGCPVALCQRRQPPKAGAVGQCLQRVAGQSSWTIKNDGWFRITKVRLTRERPYAKTVRLFKTDSSPFTRGFSPPPTPQRPGGSPSNYAWEMDGLVAVVRKVADIAIAVLTTFRRSPPRAWRRTGSWLVTSQGQADRRVSRRNGRKEEMEHGGSQRGHAHG